MNSASPVEKSHHMYGGAQLVCYPINNETTLMQFILSTRLVKLGRGDSNECLWLRQYRYTIMDPGLLWG